MILVEYILLALLGLVGMAELLELAARRYPAFGEWIDRWTDRLMR